MIRSIKREQKKVLKGKKENFFRKLYKREKGFYNFIQWIETTQRNFRKKRSDRRDFKTIMQRSFGDSPYPVFGTERWSSACDNHTEYDINSVVVEMLLNQKYQKKIGYTVEIFTGEEYLEWYKENFLPSEKDSNYLWRLAELQSDYDIKNNQKNPVFYVIKHQ